MVMALGWNSFGFFDVKNSFSESVTRFLLCGSLEGVCENAEAEKKKENRKEKTQRFFVKMTLCNEAFVFVL